MYFDFRCSLQLIVKTNIINDKDVTHFTSFENFINFNIYISVVCYSWEP